jgi:anti-sigma B factor antagonist
MEAGSEFSVTRRRAGDCSIVAPTGEIDLATVDELAAALEDARAEANVVYLDLRGVIFMDSAGVRLVIEADRQCELVVVRGPIAVRRVFDLVGLEERVRMVDALPGE